VTADRDTTTLAEERQVLESIFDESACGRLAESEQAYYSTHGEYVPPLARLLNATRTERDDLRRRLAEAQEALREYGRHVPPCPRWVTSGSPDLNPCLCGFDSALAAGRDT
jgi:hypothetical protein